MHIPDGFLDAKTSLAAGALAAGAVAFALREARDRLPRRTIPLMGLTAAFLFAAQMVNFPIGAGTTGHLVGSVLAAVLLGPAPAILVMTSVLVLQCLLFADGGITALGANALNMAVLGTLGGYGINVLVGRVLGGQRGWLVAAAFGAWSSTVLAAMACGAELVVSGWSPVVLPAMGSVHMVIGLGEATLTALILAAIARTRPELIFRNQETDKGRNRVFAFAGLAIALGLAVFAAPLSSEHPDGLERVAEGQHVEQSGKAPMTALMDDYRMPGLPFPGLATAAAGAAGTLLAFGVAVALSRLLLPAPDARTSH